jgi:transposase-like protein
VLKVERSEPIVKRDVQPHSHFSSTLNGSTRQRSALTASPTPPDPEVVEKAKRRAFSAEYKLGILREADSCTASGEIGALLRREGLYSSNLTDWRRQRERGELEALSPKQRGRKQKPADPMNARLAQVEKENARLMRRLEQAETIIEVQKKVAALLGNPLPDENDEER